MAVFLAGLTFGFIHFPVVIFYYFSLLIVFIFPIFVYYLLIIVLLFYFIFCYLFFLFLTSAEVSIGVCSSVERLDELEDMFVVCSAPSSPHLQALRVLSVVCSPLSQFLMFSVFFYL